MWVSLDLETRNRMLSAIASRMTGGKCVLMAGEIPVAVIELGDVGDPVRGSLKFIPDKHGIARAKAEIKSARFVDASGATVLECSASAIGDGGFVELTSVNVSIGDLVKITRFEIEQPKG